VQVLVIFAAIVLCNVGALLFCAMLLRFVLFLAFEAAVATSEPRSGPVAGGKAAEIRRSQARPSLIDESASFDGSTPLLL